jgi:D-alanyl-D-alanine carboxypeptidase
MKRLLRVANLRIAAVLVILVAGADAPAFGQDESLAKQLAKRLVEMECPGALVGIFPDDGVPTRLAIGVADVDSRRPMSLDMHMYVGSVMKPFVGTVVLQLADEGILSLDDPIAKYVEGAPRGEEITLRMLGSNTSGLFNTIENKKFQAAIMKDPPHLWTTPEILKYTFVRDSYFPPGDGWRYSNTNAVLLGMAVEKVTGKGFAEVLAERVLGPLGLAHTGMPADGQLPAPRPSSYRNGYPDKVIGYGDVFYDVSDYSASWTGAAGNLYSTLDDLGNATRPIDMGELLSDQGKAELHHWIDTGHKGIEYGFCIGRRGEAIGHPGDVPGFNAFASYFPERHLSIVVLTNLSNNDDDTMPADELAKVVVAHLGE